MSKTSSKHWLNPSAATVTMEGGVLSYGYDGGCWREPPPYPSATATHVSEVAARAGTIAKQGERLPGEPLPVNVDLSTVKLAMDEQWPSGFAGGRVHTRCFPTGRWRRPPPYPGPRAAREVSYYLTSATSLSGTPQASPMSSASATPPPHEQQCTDGAPIPARGLSSRKPIAMSLDGAFSVVGDDEHEHRHPHGSKQLQAQGCEMVSNLSLSEDRLFSDSGVPMVPRQLSVNGTALAPPSTNDGPLSSAPAERAYANDMMGATLLVSEESQAADAPPTFPNNAVDPRPDHDEPAPAPATLLDRDRHRHASTLRRHCVAEDALLSVVPASYERPSRHRVAEDTLSSVVPTSIEPERRHCVAMDTLLSSVVPTSIEPPRGHWVAEDMLFSVVPTAAEPTMTMTNAPSIPPNAAAEPQPGPASDQPACRRSQLERRQLRRTGSRARLTEGELLSVVPLEGERERCDAQELRCTRQAPARSACGSQAEAQTDEGANVYTHQEP